jgi:hypothetical protein
MFRAKFNNIASLIRSKKGESKIQRARAYNINSLLVKYHDLIIKNNIFEF